MKRLVIFSLLLFLSHCAIAQSLDYPSRISTPTMYRHLQADSAFGLPYGSTKSLRANGYKSRPGQLFYSTSDSTLYWWTGSQWIKGGTGDPIDLSGIRDSIARTWAYGGNVGTTSADYIGPNDSIPFQIKVFNQRMFWMTPNGRGMAWGRGAMASNPNCIGCMALGDSALASLNVGTSPGGLTGDIAIGYHALKEYRQGVGGGDHGSNLVVGTLGVSRSTRASRTTLFGNFGLALLDDSPENAGFGVFTLERTTHGLGVNFAGGSNAGRQNAMGFYNTYLGGYNGSFGSTYITGLNILDGGTGYGTGTGSDTVIITVSPARIQPINTPYPSVTAIFKAIVTGGSITNYTVVQEGMYYDSIPTVTVSGNGSGAILTPIVKSASENSDVGQGGIIFNKYGSFLTGIGRHNGVGDGGNEASTIDDYMTFIGYKTSRSYLVPTTRKLQFGTGLGALVKVRCSNCVVIGRPTDSIAIGVDSARYPVDIARQTVVSQLMIRPAGTAALIDFLNSSGVPMAEIYKNTVANRLGISTNGYITNDIAGTIRSQIDQYGLTAPTGFNVGFFGARSTSAIAQITSTTQGFMLTPITASQRDAIATPSPGLLVNVSDDSSFYRYDGSAWKRIAGSGGVVGSISLSSIGSTPNANAASLSGSTLNLQPADTTYGGVLNTTTQSIAGTKKFKNGITTSTIDPYGSGIDVTVNGALFGKNASATTYNVLSFNGSNLDAGFAGLMANPNPLIDPDFFIQSLKRTYFRTNGNGFAGMISENQTWGIGTAYAYVPTERLEVNGNIKVSGKINVTTGTNASLGTATLSSGTVTVSTTAVTASSKIFVTLSSCSSCGAVYVGTITAGTSFVINSASGSDASTVNWWIVN